jgi:serine protease SohB
VVGSIGAIAATFGLHEAIGKLGIERRVLTAGSKKLIFDPFRPVKEEEAAIIQGPIPF